MEGLGKDFVVVPVATGKHISLKNARGVTFITYEDGGAQALTLKQSKAGLSEKALSVIDVYFASDGIGGVWTRETDDAVGANGGSDTMTKKDTTAFDAAAFYVDASDLDVANGFDSVELAVDGAGLCIAIVHGLKVQRALENLPAASVA